MLQNKKINRIYQLVEIASPLWEITCHMGSHSVTHHPTAVNTPPSPQPKQVLDFATPEGCKAELSCVVVISQDCDAASAPHALVRQTEAAAVSCCYAASRSQSVSRQSSTRIHRNSYSCAYQMVDLIKY